MLASGPGLEGHPVIFLAIRTRLSRRFFLAIDSVSLRWSGSLRRSGFSSQIGNQP